MSSFFVRFQTTMISQEGLYRIIDPSQLTEDFDGTLPYEHEEWIELRLVSNATLPLVHWHHVTITCHSHDMIKQ